MIQIFTCLYIEPAKALKDALSICVLLDFSLTHVTADAVSEALTSACTSILFLKLKKKKTQINIITMLFVLLLLLFFFSLTFFVR